MRYSWSRQGHSQREGHAHRGFPPISFSIMNRILIVRACAIGDFVLNLPALEALSRASGSVGFTLVGYPATLDLARDFVRVEAVHSIESQPWCRLFYESIPGLSFDSTVSWMKD